MLTNWIARITMCFAGFALLTTPVWAQQAAQTRRPGMAGRLRIVGRWNINVSEGDAVYPSWLGVRREDGGLKAQFLGRAGGVGGTEDFKFENGTVTFKAHGREWVGKLDGRTIEGTWKQGDKQGKWTAQRSIPRMDLSGKWNVKVGNKTATLTLVHNGRRISGTWKEDGKETEISDAALRFRRLRFTVDGRQFSPMVKGDVLEGTRFKGQRERQWGQPIELFNGRQADLTNWEPLEKNRGLSWKVVDGVLTNGGHGTENIVTKRKDFRNFKLHVEFKVPERGNSGVYLRGRHEVQIADSYDRPIEAGGCGAMYSRVLPKVNASKPPGEWQTFDIVFIDSYLTVLHNDQVIMDNVEVEGITGGAIDSNEWAPGPIYLQGDHSEIFFRKIILTPAK